MYCKSLFAVCIVFMILGLSCSDDDNPVSSEDIIGSGNLVTEELTLADFHSVRFTIVGDINLTSGAAQAVSITVDDNIIDHIVTSVEDGVLTISSNPNAAMSEYDLTFDLTMTDLNELELIGVGNITGVNGFQVDSAGINLQGVGNIYLDLDADYLHTIHGGVGNILLIGSVTKHVCEYPGVGQINAFEFISDTTIISLSGVGDASVYANDYLDVNISGSGSLLYKGNPTIVQEITGLGQIIDAN